MSDAASVCVGDHPRAGRGAEYRCRDRAIPRDVVDEVVVIDGGSRDATREVARQRGARVGSEPRRGYGRACAHGASEARGEIVVFLDADGASDPHDIQALVAPIAEGRADPVLGSRLGPGRAAAGWPRPCLSTSTWETDSRHG